MIKYLKCKHLEDAGEGYFEHFSYTIKMALRIIVTGIIILLHGIFPFLLTKTASARIEWIYLSLKSRIGKARLEEIEESWNI